MVGNGAFASTIVDGNIMYAVVVEYPELGVARHGVCTGSAKVVELYSQADSFERSPDEIGPGPPLQGR